MVKVQTSTYFETILKNSFFDCDTSGFPTEVSTCENVTSYINCELKKRNSFVLSKRRKKKKTFARETLTVTGTFCKKSLFKISYIEGFNVIYKKKIFSSQNNLVYTFENICRYYKNHIFPLSLFFPLIVN